MRIALTLLLLCSVSYGQRLGVTSYRVPFQNSVTQSLPAGAKIILLATTVSGGDGTLSSASVPWLDQSGNHFDAYAVNPGGVYITNSSTHKAWHSKSAASGWFITNSAYNVLNNLTGATMLCTVTIEATNSVGSLSWVNVSSGGPFGRAWLAQWYPAIAGQDSLDFTMRRIATDSGQGLFGPGVSRNVRYTAASIVNWNAQTGAIYTNGVQLSSVSGAVFSSGNTDNNASQGISLMCNITASGPTYGNAMSGTFANYVLYPFILSAAQISQASSYLNSLP